MIFDPENPDTRELIDAFKATRLCDPYKAAAFSACVEHPEAAARYWIEQMGDAELYEEAYRQGTSK